MRGHPHLLVVSAVVAHAWTAAAWAQSADPARWNKIFTDPKSNFIRNPNAFLVETVKPLNPGRALDVGMGQGRNALWLAQQGWEVTGADISEEGIRLAREQAIKIGVRLNTVLKSADEFDYGRDQWHLIIGIFMHDIYARNAAKIVEGLKPPDQRTATRL